MPTTKPPIITRKHLNPSSHELWIDSPVRILVDGRVMEEVKRSVGHWTSPTAGTLRIPSLSWVVEAIRKETHV